MESDFRKSFFFDDNFFFEKVSIPKIFEKSHFFFDHFLVVKNDGKFSKILKIFGIDFFRKKNCHRKKNFFENPTP